MHTDGAELPGSALAVAGIPLPTLDSQRAVLLDITRLPSPIAAPDGPCRWSRASWPRTTQEEKIA
ncbi:hypothetical protein Psi02_73720 [Planotetraspora silvatica]|uniref:Uncharacterized protein n=1 Tax=Planotetraspora silvatica TaxID=234614 RepID=A0A8J3UTD6_9ACTN|nr:hypothetical protein [Planotetraspora silvatica]GII50948.1 hypothetical protein Psi02_73720 [Planotetraspora silvatica]